MIRLSVTTSAGRTTFSSERAEILIGSREGADLRIEHDGVARNHCLLRAENGVLTLVDLGSPKGVQFAGQIVRQARMQVGSAFRVGDVLIEIESAGVAPAKPGLESEPGAAPRRPGPAVIPAAAAAAAATPKAPPPRRPTSSDPRGRSAARSLLEETAAPSKETVGQKAAGAAAPVPHGQVTDFGREIRQMLAKAPWYAISGIVHALVLFVLWQIPYDTVVPEARIGLQAVLEEANGEEAESAEDLNPDIEDLKEETPDEEFDELEDKPIEREEMPAPMEVLEDTPVKIGLSTPNYRIKMSKLKGKTLENGEALIDRGNVKGAQEAAKDAIQRGVGRGLQRLRGIPANRIVVIKGEFDEMETVLSLYKVPHVTIERAHLISYNLKNAKALCINCGRTPTSLQRSILVNKVKKFVEGGGWLITSDWALAPYLTEAFPGYVTEIVPRKRQVDTTVAVEESVSNSPLLRDVFGRRKNVKTMWWLEEASKFVGTKGSRVKVLVRSDDMKQRYGSGKVAVEFRPRRGRVLHLMGHFYQKDGNHAGVVAMHRLIFNFLQERFPGVSRGSDDGE